MSVRATRLRQQFERFAQEIRIASKDVGMVPLHLWQTQRYIVDEILQGIDDGIRDFVILKPRQVGCTTVLTVFTLFWHLKHAALQGGYVAHVEAATALFRDNIHEMAIHIDDPRFMFPVRSSNRNMLAWAHNARLQYATAGTRENKALGRSKGLTYLFADEVAYWGGPGGVASLKATLSDRHPARMSLWASTANGYNLFHSMWQTAQRAVTSKAIFAPWWRHELYRTDAVAQGDRILEVYWDGILNAEEAAWQDEITRRWDVTLEPAQWAWWRWQLAEKAGDDLNKMHEEYPTLPEHAFQATGRGYLPSRVTARLREQLRAAPQPTMYRYGFGKMIEDTELLPTVRAMAQLKVWEEPRPREHYVVSCDPSFASSSDSDMAVVQVWRCERYRITQVAEFAANEVEPSRTAWVLAHLCGAYPESHLVLELNGPGYQVWQEILRLQMYGWGTNAIPQLSDVFSSIQYYLFRRLDALSGRGFWHYKANNQQKIWIFSGLRDRLAADQVLLRSAELVDELQVVRYDGRTFGAQEGACDDRVVAAALAAEMWAAQVIPILNLTPAPIADEPAPWPLPEDQRRPRLVSEFFDRLHAIR